MRGLETSPSGSSSPDSTVVKGCRDERWMMRASSVFGLTPVRLRAEQGLLVTRELRDPAQIVRALREAYGLAHARGLEILAGVLDVAAADGLDGLRTQQVEVRGRGGLERVQHVLPLALLRGLIAGAVKWSSRPTRSPNRSPAAAAARRSLSSPPGCSGLARSASICVRPAEASSEGSRLLRAMPMSSRCCQPRAARRERRVRLQRRLHRFEQRERGLVASGVSA